MQLKNQILKQGNFLFKNRSNIPIIIVIVALIVFTIQNKTINSNLYDKIITLSIIISFIGLIIRVLAVGYSNDNTSGRNTKVGQVADSVNTNGIYSLVRHPLYIGNFFMWLGAAILTYNFWFIVAFVLFYFLYYERIIYVEEHFLSNKFLDKYDNWAAKTNIIFPKFKAYRKPNNQFDLIKVLTKEKNGFAAIFILVFLFKSFHNYFYAGKSFFSIDIWFYLLIFSLLLYVILKVVKMQLKKKNRKNKIA